MKRFLKKTVLASVAIVIAITDVTAQIDYQQSLGIMCSEKEDFMFAEGGNWKIPTAALASVLIWETK